MTEINSGSVTWTLLFKNHKTTVLLLVSPTQSLNSIKQKLLDALKSRGTQDINGDPVPENASEIEFGVHVDVNDYKKGWVNIEIKAQEVTEEERKRILGGKKSILNASPQAAGLKDSQIVAFRFRRLTGDETANELGIDLDDPGWDVILPSYGDEEDEEDD